MSSAALCSPGPAAPPSPGHPCCRAAAGRAPYGRERQLMEDHRTAHTAGADEDVDAGADTASVLQKASPLQSEQNPGVTEFRRSADDVTMRPTSLSTGVRRRTTAAAGV